MIRTSITSVPGDRNERDPELPWPGVEEAYAIEDRALGVRFYRACDGFFLPYTLLQAVQYTPTRLTLKFPGEDIVIDGRGLHGVYVALCRQAVTQVVLQGERGRAATTCILGIERIPREDGPHRPGEG